MSFELILSSDTINQGRIKINDAFSATTSLWTGGTGDKSLVHNSETGNEATSQYSIVGGQSSLASGDTSYAFGNQSVAGGDFSFATGELTKAIGDNSKADGYNTSATGNKSYAGGQNSLASGDTSYSFGNEVVAGGDFSFAGGEDSIAQGTNSFVFSKNSKVIGTRSVVLGGQNITGTTSDTVFVPSLEISKDLKVKNEIGRVFLPNTTIISKSLGVTSGSYSSLLIFDIAFPPAFGAPDPETTSTYFIRTEYVATMSHDNGSTFILCNIGGSITSQWQVTQTVGISQLGSINKVEGENFTTNGVSVPIITHSVSYDSGVEFLSLLATGTNTYSLTPVYWKTTSYITN